MSRIAALVTPVVPLPTWSGVVSRPRWRGRRRALVEGWPERVLARGAINVDVARGSTETDWVEVSVDHGVSWRPAPAWAEDLAIAAAVAAAYKENKT